MWHEAEETILLSDVKKQISIKPIESIVTRANAPQDDAKEVHQQLTEAISCQKQELASIEEKQKKRVEEADNQIEEARKKWETEKQELIELARKQGFHKGYEDGKQEAYTQFEYKLQEANHIVDIAKEDYHQTLEKQSESIVEIAMATANKVLHNELKEQPDYIRTLIKDALDEVKSQPIISIVIHPDYYEEVHSYQEELQRIIGDETKLSIHADMNIQPTDCIIQYPHGQIETSVNTQLEKIREALMDYVMEDAE
ncbi:flagellar assembly protein H [Oceanobacillus oncorhynchi]|uniref:Flagellar assembly protein FliH n=1 Tax=Oceanobacillus oncorhynchi TaxID=545501 RepID=A0A0A1MG08_9BACI|nr:flagellar assembly protein H [Oceanobacillus oncorhynchi]